MLKDEIVDDLFTNVLFVSLPGMTKKTYVESILEGIKQSKEEKVDIDVRYLISIDRRGGPSAAKEAVKLAEEFFLSTEDTVLGLDLSGDPAVSYFSKICFISKR